MTAAARKIAFQRIAETALRYSNTLVQRWLPNGKREGVEWVSLNPTRADHKRGSFKVNLSTGRWSDFAAGAAGGDLVALGAYLFRLKQSQAAVKIADMLGIGAYDD